MIIDENRTARELYTNNNQGMPISILKASSDTQEAHMVAKEINRIVELSDGLIKYRDIAIIIRMNFLSQKFVDALMDARIPFVVVSLKLW